MQTCARPICRAGEADVVLQSRAGHMNRGAQVSDISGRFDIQIGIDGAIAGEMDFSFLQIESPPGKLITSPHQISRTQHGGIGDRPPDLQVRAPFTVLPKPGNHQPIARPGRSEEHTYELKSLMRISYAVYRLKKKNNI